MFYTEIAIHMICLILIQTMKHFLPPPIIRQSVKLHRGKYFKKSGRLMVCYIYLYFTLSSHVLAAREQAQGQDHLESPFKH